MVFGLESPLFPGPDTLNDLVFIDYVYSHKKLIRHIKIYIWIGRHNINQKMFPASKRISFFSSMSSRLVSVAAPYLTLYLPAVTFKQLPFLVFGFGALLASMASIFVPESLGHPLPDTLEDAAQFGTKSFWSCWSRKKLEDEIACQRLRNLENKEN